MAQVVHKVRQGDTLSEIAQFYRVQHGYTDVTVESILKLNPGITDPDKIYVGEEIVITGTATAVKTNNTQYAVVERFGLQSGTERTIFATWTWDSSKNKTENYKVRWYYATGDGVNFIGNDSTVTLKQSTYTAPENAFAVTFYVQPVSKKDNKGKAYFTSGWSTKKIYYFSSKANPPKTPQTPTVEIKDNILKARLDNIPTDMNAEGIQFQIVENDKKVIASIEAKIDKTSLTAACQDTVVYYGSKFKVRCRSYGNGMYSEWSSYSSNIATIPFPPEKFTEIRATSKTSVYLKWDRVKTGDVKGYEIEYTTEKRYFDTSNQTTVVSNIGQNFYEITGLQTGDEYFFRVRSVNDTGASLWMPKGAIKSITIGKPPSAPTTWSSTTTAITGEPLNLYWVHNSEDGSRETLAELEVFVDGVKQVIPTIENTTNEDEPEKIGSYAIDTSQFKEGSNIIWRVRTSGVTKEWGEWSVARTIDIYATPYLEMDVIDGNDEYITVLESFPFTVKALAGPNTQKPISYNLSIIANETYETVDNFGNDKIVSEGELVYSEQFDTSERLEKRFNAAMVSLENNIEYTIKCIVAMNSGLTAEDSKTLTIAWSAGDHRYWPNLEISIDPETYTATIRPYCTDENGDLINGVMMSLYRREFDGRFTELADLLMNTDRTTVSDPHPALDYARYRVVATDIETGTVSYYDAPGYPVGGKAAIIQWDEAWSNFESTDDILVEPSWSGSMLKLPYNIKISDNNQKDVELVEYIGREHPVSYYGTHKGSSSTWSMDIPSEDKETLYALRRLANWMGDAYVREPTGSGYWANVKVSFNQDLKSVIIPVSISITRVEGGK